MPDNPYLVVGQPNYAAPLVNFFGNQQQKPAQQNNGRQQGQQNPQAPGPGGQGSATNGSAAPGMGFAQYLAKLFAPQQQQPGMPPQGAQPQLPPVGPNGPAGLY